MQKTTVSTKPYLLRAIYQWCVDQGLTPYIAVAVDGNVKVPPGYTHDGQIVLNIGEAAIHGLSMGNDYISFQARFNGRAESLLFPVGNVTGIYARENGQGMAFEVETATAPAPQPSSEPEPTAPSPSRGSHLKRIK